VVGRWPVRRRPVRLVRGAVDDTPPAAENLARLPDVVFLVDGYNVSKTAWPDLDLGAQRLRLVNAVAELRVRLGTRIELVFDGTARGQLQTRALPAAVRVWFSPEEVEADDLILSLVDEQPPERPVVVVSSDRRVQDGARRRGASVLSSATFLCLLR
jgi:predicted RNA-binding protein with PIN domain